MKTITVQKIDGFDIIRNIYDASGLIDPEMTKSAVAIKIKDTVEWGDVEEVNSQMQVYANQAVQAKRNARDAKTQAEKKKFWDEYLLRNGQMAELMETLKPLAVALKIKTKELTIEHAIYFNPKPGDEILDDVQAEDVRAAMIAATQDGKVVDKQLNEIDDFRGKKYWKKINKKWQKSDIEKLGVIPATGAVEEKNLTPEQNVEIEVQTEKDRVSELSTAEKAAEKEIALASLVTQAALMKTELDIMGDEESLEKAQEWLAEQTEIVKEKYQ